MTLPIIIFGSLILLAGVLLLINPQILFGFLRANIGNPAIHVIAVLVRFIIGVLLISQSGLSRFPIAIELVGWVLVIAAFLLAVIGRANFVKLVLWVLTKFSDFGRAAGVMAMGFGGFLVYAFL